MGLTLGLVFSIMINFFLVIFFAATKIGGEAWKRWRNKQLYKKGNFVNTLMISKDGTITEEFTKVNEGKFKFKDLPYIRNPRLLMPYRGIPTYIHREDEPAPINIWGADFDTNLLSAAEMDTVMTSQANFDLAEWIQKYLPFVLIAVGALAIALAVLGYYEFSIHSMLRDGTFKAVEVVASTPPPAVIGG